MINRLATAGGALQSAFFLCCFYASDYHNYGWGFVGPLFAAMTVGSCFEQIEGESK